MSNTRKADPAKQIAGEPFRQEKFSSHPKFERGLMGNLVAKRTALLTDRAEIELIWALQFASWQPGGLVKLATDITSAWRERVASPLMQKYGCKPGQVYDAKKAKAIHMEIHFPNETDRTLADVLDAERRANGEPQYHNPGATPVSSFTQELRSIAERELIPDLSELCLNPDLDVATFAPRYFPTLVATLREHFRLHAERLRADHVVTALGRQVWETLDYCRDSRCMVLIDGLARTGKTFSARAWCELRPGSARYVQCPSSNDDVGFFRAIAKSLGVSINQNSKAQQLRDRIEDVLQRGQLTLCLDEAHYAWPSSNYREALPNRINWIMTALVNHGVSVALVTTPQFMRTQKAVERKSAWTSEQFVGRIGHYQKLPESLSKADLTAVARALLPEGCARSIEALVCYAEGSTKYLAAIETAVRRAKHLAAKVNRSKVVFGDIREAIKGSAIPSDNALYAALSDPRKAPRSGYAAPPLAPLSAPPSAPAATSNRRNTLAVMETPHADRAGAEKVAA